MFWTIYSLDSLVNLFTSYTCQIQNVTKVMAIIKPIRVSPKDESNAEDIDKTHPINNNKMPV